MTTIEQYSKRVSSFPETEISTIIEEEWYKLLSDTDKAEFWTEILNYAFTKYGADELSLIISVLDNYIYEDVRDMIIANVRTLEL